MIIDKFFNQIKGGKGSGNWGHKGRPGKRGGSAPRKNISGYLSDRKTKEISIEVEGVKPNVDVAIVDLIETMNKNGLTTTQSCSGHTCSKPPESHISYRSLETKPKSEDFSKYITDRAQKKFNKDMRSYLSSRMIKDTVNSKELKLDWVVAKTSGGSNLLTLRRGWFGDGSLLSTETNVKNAIHDLNVIKTKLKKIQKDYPV